jgi:hypothetical protein
MAIGRRAAEVSDHHSDRIAFCLTERIDTLSLGFMSESSPPVAATMRNPKAHNEIRSKPGVAVTAEDL